MPTIDNVLYTARTHTTGGRDGIAKSDDGRLEVALASPGSSAAGTNPEQLFAAGWSACFIGALGIAATQQKLKLPPGTAVDTEIDLGTNGDGYLLQARLNVSLPGIGAEAGRALVDAAHGMCPYSKATRGNIAVAVNLV